ncbi:hypothetical protein [Snodgrassella alvi]|uniref:hypothetical protein n=1 Tax=Snodgrassella alvi TaxID=1196083 RepID=UPI000C1F6D28|nr:hypothetical protein [Snodgrassella alvi]PIT39803.1 hypothetical protein BHC53_08805 [Snodgrassella alvi]
MVKNQYEQQNQFVFTLSEDNPPAQQSMTNTDSESAESKPDWVRNLEQLRQNKKKHDNHAVHHDVNKSIKPTVVVNQTRRHEQAFHTSAVVTGKVPHNRQPATAKPKKPNPSQYNQTDEVVLDPIQRERVYRAYLQQWQQQSTLEAQQQESALNDTALLIQEDWLAAQSCLQSAPIDETLPSGCTVQLKGNQATVVQAENSESDVTDVNTDFSENGQPVIHVHMHVIEPRGTANRAVTCISEQALLQQLSEKLRPHLADVLSGMVRVAVQKHTAGLVTTLQRELLAEVPSAVDDVLKYNLTQVMNNFKKRQR